MKADFNLAIGAAELATRPFETEAEAGGDWQAELRDGCGGGGVLDVEEIFGGGEEVDAVADGAPGHGIEDEEASEGKHVLVVVVLLADHAAVYGNIDARGIQVASLKCEDVVRDLRDPQSDERGHGVGEAGDDCVDILISERQTEFSREMRGGVNFKSGCAGASKILALSGDESRSGADSDVRDRVDYFIEEERSAGFEFVLEAVDGEARVPACEFFGAKIGIRICKRIALAERAIELVQSGRAKRAVDRGVPGHVRIDLMLQREARAEGVVGAIGENCICGTGTCNWVAEEKGVCVAPVVVASANGKQPTWRDLD